jgi:hypothetical protein
MFRWSRRRFRARRRLFLHHRLTGFHRSGLRRRLHRRGPL